MNLNFKSLKLLFAAQQTVERLADLARPQHAAALLHLGGQRREELAQGPGVAEALQPVERVRDLLRLHLLAGRAHPRRERLS